MYSKKFASPPGPPPVASRTPSRTAVAVTVIGAADTLTGDLRAGGDVHVEGTVCGDIACASLVLGESGRVEGAITADSARLGGTVTGAVAVRDLVILKTARIAGDVTYETLTIEQGAGVDGHLRSASGQREPTPVLQAPEGEPRLALAGQTGR